MTNKFNNVYLMNTDVLYSTIRLTMVRKLQSENTYSPEDVFCTTLGVYLNKVFNDIDTFLILNDFESVRDDITKCIRGNSHER